MKTIALVFLLTGCAKVYKVADELETAAIVVKRSIEQAEEEKMDKTEPEPVMVVPRPVKVQECEEVESGWLWKTTERRCK